MKWILALLKSVLPWDACASTWCCQPVAKDACSVWCRRHTDEILQRDATGDDAVP